ncbi:MAG TPA: IS1182 family transposase [Pirellulaceae bacterium]|nr:IS1182 family transposase [Planctomycetales bacterium]HRX80179.1 IS1182 family transposase [Pirellulaceae bacterium]
MSQRKRKANYWQDAPLPRHQLVLIPTALEEMIPEDHPVRLVDEILDTLDWTKWEAAYHGSHGQPPVHPSVLVKILLFAMIRRIRSSRQIEYQLKHSIDFMWLTSGRKLDHSTLSEFRKNHTDELRDIFQQMIKSAIDLKIANLSELCIDGTRVLADASRRKTWTTERLTKALEYLDAQIAQALETIGVNDAIDEDLLGQDISADRLPAEVANLKSRRAQLAANLETAKQMDEDRKRNDLKGPAQIPKTDTDSRILPNKEGGYAPNYTPMVTTETLSGLIVHCDVLIGNVEHDQLTTIVDAVASDYEVEVKQVAADSAYTTGRNLTAAEERSIELIGPLSETRAENNPAERKDLSQPVAEDQLTDLPLNPQTKRFGKSAFIYDEASDSYYCPAGKVLPYRYSEKSKRRDGSPVQLRTYICPDCVGCPLTDLCRKNAESKDGRKLKDEEYEGARRRHRERMKTEAAKEAYSRRQHFGETPFAVIKCCFDMRRFLLRGIEGVGQEWRWASTAFNLKKLMSLKAVLRTAPSKSTTVAVV